MRAQHVEAVEPGQHQVEDDEVRGARARRAQRRWGRRSATSHLVAPRISRLLRSPNARSGLSSTTRMRAAHRGAGSAAASRSVGARRRSDRRGQGDAQRAPRALRRSVDRRGAAVARTTRARPRDRSRARRPPRAAGSRANGSNIAPRSAAAIPGPSSSTTMRRRGHRSDLDAAPSAARPVLHRVVEQVEQHLPQRVVAQGRGRPHVHAARVCAPPRAASGAKLHDASRSTSGGSVAWPGGRAPRAPLGREAEHVSRPGGRAAWSRVESATAHSRSSFVRARPSLIVSMTRRICVSGVRSSCDTLVTNRLPVRTSSRSRRICRGRRRHATVPASSATTWGAATVAARR